MLSEYRFGIGQSRRRGDYEKWLRELIAATRFTVVADETSRRYAKIRAALKKAGRTIPSNDFWSVTFLATPSTTSSRTNTLLRSKGSNASDGS